MTKATAFNIVMALFVLLLGSMLVAGYTNTDRAQEFGYKCAMNFGHLNYNKCVDDSGRVMFRR